MTRLAPQALALPQAHPRRDEKPTTREDARWALIRAARYLGQGGSREAVGGYVDEWLDYWLELDERERATR